ncbi:hypothetical protein C8Q79DRAFT_131446 [Trametes meyenii]|nr:hypothetical protein C8Q79DRAFT_131446 [Trametes meyenii]
MGVVFSGIPAETHLYDVAMYTGPLDHRAHEITIRMHMPKRPSPVAHCAPIHDCPYLLLVCAST